MRKRGSIELSFGMIFSIIVVIAIVAIGFYVIKYFLDLGECTEVGLFYDEFQEAVDRAWRSELARDTFEGSLPGGITSVCIGDLTQGGSGDEFSAFQRYSRSNANTFLYPIEHACGNSYITTDHLAQRPFTCFPVINNRVQIGLEKTSTDTLVHVTNG